MIDTWLNYSYGAHLIDWLILGAIMCYGGALWYQSRKWR